MCHINNPADKGYNIILLTIEESIANAVEPNPEFCCSKIMSFKSSEFPDCADSISSFYRNYSKVALGNSIEINE
jgi:hypothetical protein